MRLVLKTHVKAHERVDTRTGKRVVVQAHERGGMGAQARNVVPDPLIDRELQAHGVIAAIDPRQVHYAITRGWLKAASPEDVKTYETHVIHDPLTHYPTVSIVRRQSVHDAEPQWYRIIGEPYHSKPYPLPTPTRRAASPGELSAVRRQSLVSGGIGQPTHDDPPGLLKRVQFRLAKWFGKSTPSRRRRSEREEPASDGDEWPAVDPRQAPADEAQAQARPDVAMKDPDASAADSEGKRQPQDVGPPEEDAEQDEAEEVGDDEHADIEEPADLSWFDQHDPGGEERQGERTPSFRPTPPPSSADEAPAWLEAVMHEPDMEEAVRLHVNGVDSFEFWQTPGGKGVKPERRSIHESIVASLLNPRAEAEAEQRPHAVLLIGSPGVKKSSLLPTLTHEFGVEWTEIDQERAQVKLPGYDHRTAGLWLTEASDIVDRQLLEQALKQRHHLVISVSGHDTKAVMALADACYQRGYELSVVAVQIPAWEAAARAVDRFRRGGPFIPPAYLLEAIGERPLVTYEALKHDPRISHWRKYDASTQTIRQAAIETERPRDGRDASGGQADSQADRAADGSPLYKAVDGVDVGGARTEQDGSTRAGTDSPLRRAHRFRADLVKSLVYLDDDLSSPDLDPTSRGVLLAERYRLITQLDTLDTKLREVAHAS